MKAKTLADLARDYRKILRSQLKDVRAQLREVEGEEGLYPVDPETCREVAGNNQSD